jgi:hypothetical protein
VIELAQNGHLVLELLELLLAHRLFLDDLDCSGRGTAASDALANLTEGSSTKQLAELIEISEFTVILKNEVRLAERNVSSILDLFLILERFRNGARRGTD